jgi:hypothetical protein
MIHILEPNIFLKISDAMGQVSGGSLKLRGWLRSFTLDRDNVTFTYRGKMVAMITVDDSRIRKRGKWYCLPITVQRLHLSTSSLEIWGLVLEQSAPRGQYSRVGVFVSRRWSFKDDNLSYLRDRPTNGKPLAWMQSSPQT